MLEQTFPAPPRSSTPGFGNDQTKPLAGLSPHHPFFRSRAASTAMGARSEKKQLKQQHSDAVALKPRPASFKKKSVLTNSRPAPVEDADPDFPRGGASLLSRQETAEARAEAEAEFEREASQQGHDSKKKKKKGSTKAVADDPDAELGSLFGDGLTGKLPRFANRITLKNISPRMKLWGVIVEVNSKDLVINLPGGLRGYVRADEASDISLDARNKDSENHLLSSIFHVGQLVSGVVLRVDDDKREGKGNKRIWLSTRLSMLFKGLTLDAVQDGMVMIAQVKSVEDHGYILHFGVPSFTGFLPRSEQDGNDICTGQLLQCIVKSIDKVRAVVYLKSDSDLVSKRVVKDLKGLSIDLLVPGMMVNARVHSTLENGIMLSFLTYFTGTVDIFHLQDSFPRGSWKDDYNQHKKVNARILFIDPSTRAIALTLNAHLVHNKVPPSHVKTGDIYDKARIVRVDKGTGLHLEIPSSLAPSPAYVSIFDVADEEVMKLEKKFREGGHVRVRVIGTRHLEGLAVGTLKASALEGSVFTHSDVKPGMVMKAKVISVDSFGAIVQFASGVKALCPLPHMSEFDIAKPAKKFKVGAELLFRVLGCKSKRITVTHKKTLVKSKLNLLSSYADAIEGLITHGWITKIEKHGCFVRFYNGVQGFAHRSELGLDPGCEPSTTYHIGQVVKCRIISSVPASRRINVSFVMSQKRSGEENTASIGSIVSGTVERLTSEAAIVNVNKVGRMKGTLSNEHLSDHCGQATQLRSLLKPGYEFDQLLVLDVEGNGFVLSAKQSLVSSAQETPSNIIQIHPSSLAHGYICNIIETGCFVRFLGRLTGFSPKNKATDEQIDNLSDAFYLGQSVRSHILDVNNEAGRIKLSLKQSLCFSTDASFIMGYFTLEEKIAALQVSGSKNSDLNWVKSFSIGTVVEGEVQEIKEFGVVLNFKNHEDIVGFIAQHQLGGSSVEIGSVVRALVLDISKSDGLIDLSLKPELVSSASAKGANGLPSKKKRQRASSVDLELHQNVNAIVEIVKENYLVLSIPEYNYAIGYASVTDYNTQILCRKHFVNGQSLLTTVGALSSPYSTGRLLLLVKCLSEVLENSSSKRAKKKSSYSVGSIVEAEIIDMQPLQLHVKFGVGFRGRVHITEVIDEEHSMENPFSKFKIGQLVKARIMAESGKGGKGYLWELSVRPSILAGFTRSVGTLMTEEFNFSVNNSVKGYVVKVDPEWVWLTVSRHVSAHIFILDTSSEPNEIREFHKRFTLGQAVIGRIISLNKEKKLLRLAPCHSLDAVARLDHQISEDHQGSSVSTIGVEHIYQGDIVGGRIKKILPGVGGLLVQIGPHLFGRVHYTELDDTWVPTPLAGFQEGQFVKCKVLEISRSPDGFVHADMSLRRALQAEKSIPTSHVDNTSLIFKRFENFDDLQPNMDVQGYVKNVSSKGCFIMLSRTIDARILLSNLSGGFIKNPEKEFPIGKLVHGRVLSVDPISKRVDVTLKTATEDQTSKSDVVSFQNLHMGDIISGHVRRTESYGLFISIDNTNMVGLCHISELSDDPIDNIESKYRAGDKVVAKILKVDEGRQRISLGMKKSYIGDVCSSPIISGDGIDDKVDGDTAMDDSLLAPELNDTFSILKLEDGCFTSFTQPTPRTSVPPLQVSLGDSESSDMEKELTLTQDKHKVNEMVARKHDRQLKKKEKEEREREISASEERSLQKDIPETEDDFEKLVRNSPNSSYVWIKYMAFMLSMVDIEKARSIAERALRTINAREEGERLNIWVAYLNLENEYGSPPEEAVSKIFQRAVQYCDPKKLHMALLGIYDRTEQYSLADELLEKMTKKFRNSCKVWLRCVQNLMKQDKDGIQSAVNRALLSLPRRKHIKFISQAAVLEFKCGVPDRGRTMFEGILREYPKRTDLWSVYLDQEMRHGDVELIRALFERATCLSLSQKKMRFLLKKYLKFEKSHGDEERVELVKRKALEYAESSLT